MTQLTALLEGTSITPKLAQVIYVLYVQCLGGLIKDKSWRMNSFTINKQGGCRKEPFVTVLLYSVSLKKGLLYFTVPVPQSKSLPSESLLPVLCE